MATKAQSNPTYTVRLAVKTPSTTVQYRMLEADVTVSGDNLDDLRTKATTALACSLADVHVLMGESPPEEIRPDLEQVWSASEVAKLYPDHDAEFKEKFMH